MTTNFIQAAKLMYLKVGARQTRQDLISPVFVKLSISLKRCIQFHHHTKFYIKEMRRRGKRKQSGEKRLLKGVWLFSFIPSGNIADNLSRWTNCQTSVPRLTLCYWPDISEDLPPIPGQSMGHQVCGNREDGSDTLYLGIGHVWLQLQTGDMGHHRENIGGWKLFTNKRSCQFPQCRILHIKILTIA